MKNWLHLFLPHARSDHFERERLTSLVRSMADGVVATDESLRIVLYNGAALNILDLNSSIEGQSLQDIFKPLDKNDKPINIVDYIQAITTPRIDRDLRLVYHDGSVANIYVSVTPVHEGYGHTGHSGFVLVLRDITHEKSLEEERNDFIGVVSHELRTPIAIAEGNISNAQFIADRSADVVGIKKALSAAHDQVLFLSALMNDLATLSRAERGKLFIEAEDINIPELVTKLIESYRPEAAAKGLQLLTDLDPNATALRSSKLYVREILQNFITNALKYTEKGNITLHTNARSGGILFAVSDTGIGISHGDQAKLFHKFFRSEDTRTRKSNGTGLGLYVTKKLASLLGARVQVESELNHGSTFTIFVPNVQRATTTQPKPDHV